ncbi:MAG: hypothetical protein WC169_08715 [Dehalococcoidia bacterium]
MKRILSLIIVIFMATTLIIPAAVSADGKPTMVYAPVSSWPVSENDVLNHTAIIYQHGYVNINPYTTQASRQNRIDWLRQQAIKGFDKSDPYFYSCLLPNSATVETAETWFGHPIVKGKWNYYIQGWFSDGTDAELHFDIPFETRR